jgi:hypothetical protein
VRIPWSADCSSTKKIDSSRLQLYGILQMTTYNEILKAADPTCCHRKKKTTHLGIAIENTFFALLCAWATFVAAKMEYLAAAKILTLATFYMIAATSTYIGLMILYKPPNHLNYESEEVDSDSDSDADVQGGVQETDESDDDMPPLVPMYGHQGASQDDRVLRQLQQVVDDTNARNQVRMTRSMYAKSAAGMASEASYKRLS